jgi:hypothetical protein
MTYQFEIERQNSLRRVRHTERDFRGEPLHKGDTLPILQLDIAAANLNEPTRDAVLQDEITIEAEIGDRRYTMSRTVQGLIERA